MACGGSKGPPAVPDVISDVVADIPADVPVVVDVEGDAMDTGSDQTSCPDGTCVPKLVQWEMTPAGAVGLRSGLRGESSGIKMSVVMHGGMSGVTTSTNGYSIVGGFEP